MFDYTLYYYSNRVQKGTGYFLNKTLHNTAVKITILVKKAKKKQQQQQRKSVLKRVLVSFMRKLEPWQKQRK